MEYSFPRYLLSKQSVDDRALNPHVYAALRSSLQDQRPLHIVEVGAGIGSMLSRLLRWGLLDKAEYTAVDEAAENIRYAREWLPLQARGAGFNVEESSSSLRMYDESRDIQVYLLASDVFDFARTQPPAAHLLIASAFLDLLPLPASLASLFSLVERDGLAWLTINFDGATIFEPQVDAQFDAQVENLYHRSMDERLTAGQPSGDSRVGRHLFSYLRQPPASGREQAGAEIIEAGPSDWVVYPHHGGYPGDEAYFLHFILHFFERTLSGHPDLDPARFAGWLAARRLQIERGELVYIAHQMDFLVRVNRVTAGLR